MNNKRASLPIYEQLSEDELRKKYPHEFTTHTAGGSVVRVRYRRVPVRDGFDIDAISLPPDFTGARGNLIEEDAA